MARIVVDQDDNWYQERLESSWRGCVHYGRLVDGEVQTQCGRQFTPEKGLFGGAVPPAVVLPVQPGQACPTCYTKAGVSVEKVEAAAPPVRRPQRSNAWTRQAGAATAIAAPLPTPVPVAVVEPTAEPADIPASDAAPPGQQSKRKEDKPQRSCWYERSPESGDTHWVIRIGRGNMTAVCGESLQWGKRRKEPAAGRCCPTCDAQRPH